MKRGTAPVRVEAWIQMGCERREVVFEVSREEMERLAAGKNDFHLALELYIDELVLMWIGRRYGWGWKSRVGDHDFSFLEDEPESDLVKVAEELNPRTQRSLVVPRLQRTRSPLSRGPRDPMKLEDASRPHEA